jgi:hypothetical protein
MKTLKEAANATIPEMRAFLETLPRGRIIDMPNSEACAVAQFATHMCGVPVSCGFQSIRLADDADLETPREPLDEWLRAFQQPLRRVRVSTLLKRLDDLEAQSCAPHED